MRNHHIQATILSSRVWYPAIKEALGTMQDDEKVCIIDSWKGVKVAQFRIKILGDLGGGARLEAKIRESAKIGSAPYLVCFLTH